MGDHMLFIMYLNFTERGIREIKDDPKRAQAARDLAKKCGCEIKQIYLTSGEYDVIQIIETANSNNIAKYASTAAWALYAAAPPAPGRWKRSQRSSRNCRKRRSLRVISGSATAHVCLGPKSDPCGAAKRIVIRSTRRRGRARRGGLQSQALWPA